VTASSTVTTTATTTSAAATNFNVNGLFMRLGGGDPVGVSDLALSESTFGSDHSQDLQPLAKPPQASKNLSAEQVGQIFSGVVVVASHPNSPVCTTCHAGET
jgi:hypothetical protein